MQYELFLFAPDGTLSEGCSLSYLGRENRALRSLKAHADPFGVGRFPLQATGTSIYKAYIQE